MEDDRHTAKMRAIAEMLNAIVGFLPLNSRTSSGRYLHKRIAEEPLS
jgi:hypothetical protein